MIARGAMLGPDQPVILHMLDIEPAKAALEGVRMELVDAAYPLLAGERAGGVGGGGVWRMCVCAGGGGGARPRCRPPPPPPDPAASPPPHLWTHTRACTAHSHPPGVVATTDAMEACKGVDVAVMVGGFPRKVGVGSAGGGCENARLLLGGGPRRQWWVGEPSK